MTQSGVDILFIILIFFCGAFVQGAAGFGFGLFSVGLLSFFLTLPQSTATVLALTVLLSVQILVRYRKFIRLGDIRVLFGAALAGRVGAYFFLASFGDALWIKRALGALLLGVVLLTALQERGRVRLPRLNPRLLELAAGGVGGFVGGAFAVGGTFFVLYMLGRYDDKRHYTANIQALFLTLNVLSLTLDAALGHLPHRTYLYVAVGALFAFLGVRLGLMCFERIPMKWIRRIVHGIVVAAACSLLAFG